MAFVNACKIDIFVNKKFNFTYINFFQFPIIKCQKNLHITVYNFEEYLLLMPIGGFKNGIIIILFLKKVSYLEVCFKITIYRDSVVKLFTLLLKNHYLPSVDKRYFKTEMRGKKPKFID